MIITRKDFLYSQYEASTTPPQEKYWGTTRLVLRLQDPIRQLMSSANLSTNPDISSQARATASGLKARAGAELVASLYQQASTAQETARPFSENANLPQAFVISTLLAQLNAGQTHRADFFPGVNTTLYNYFVSGENYHPFSSNRVTISVANPNSKGDVIEIGSTLDRIAQSASLAIKQPVGPVEAAKALVKEVAEVVIESPHDFARRRMYEITRLNGAMRDIKGSNPVGFQNLRFLKYTLASQIMELWLKSKDQIEPNPDDPFPVEIGLLKYSDGPHFLIGFRIGSGNPFQSFALPVFMKMRPGDNRRFHDFARAATDQFDFEDLIS